MHGCTCRERLKRGPCCNPLSRKFRPVTKVQSPSHFWHWPFVLPRPALITDHTRPVFQDIKQLLRAGHSQCGLLPGSVSPPLVSVLSDANFPFSLLADCWRCWPPRRAGWLDLAARHYRRRQRRAHRLGRRSLSPIRDTRLPAAGGDRRAGPVSSSACLPPGRYDVSASTAAAWPSKTSRGRGTVRRRRRGGAAAAGAGGAARRPSPSARRPMAVDTQSSEVSQRGDAGGHRRPAAEWPALYRSGAAVSGRDAGPARPDLRLQRRSLVRRRSRLSEQLPGGRRRRQQFLLRPGARALSRALPVQQRGHQGVSCLVQLLQRGTGARRRRSVQRGHQVGHQQLAWQRLLLSARPRLRRPAGLTPPASPTIASSSSAAPWAARSAKTAFSSTPASTSTC